MKKFNSLVIILFQLKKFIIYLFHSRYIYIYIDCDDDVDDSSQAQTMRTTLRAAAALLDALRRRALSNAPTDANSNMMNIIFSRFDFFVIL